MQSLTRIAEETSFIGMNDKYPSHLLPSGMFELLQNAVVDSNSISKRKGTDNIAASIASQDVLGLSAYETIAGTKYIVACINGASNARLWYWTGSGTFTALGTANITKDLQMNFVQANGKLYGFNGAEAVSLDSTLTVTLSPATIPGGLVAAWFHNYMFVANTTANPSRLFLSNVGDSDTFTVATDYVDINANDGDEITALYPFGNELYVFKKNTIWSISGFSSATFTATTAATQNLNSRIYGYGTPSQKSIINTGQDLYYLSFNGDIPHFRSFNQTQFSTTLEQGVVSWDVEGTMDGVNKAQLSKVAGIYDGKYVYWALPNGSSLYNNVVLVFWPKLRFKGVAGITYRSWTKWTGITPAQFAQSDISGQSKIYFGDGTTGGFVFQLNASTYDDNGTAISMDVRTRTYESNRAKKSKFKYLYFKHKTGSAGSLGINARIERALTFTSQLTESLQGSTSGLGPTGTFTLGVSVLGAPDRATVRVPFKQLTGHMLDVQFLEETANSCDIYDYSIYGVKKGLRAS